MKRSEAIEAIGKVLTYGKNGFPPEKRHAYGKKSLADMILTELESLGMTPPQQVIKCGDNYFEGYRLWEDENET